MYRRRSVLVFTTTGVDNFSFTFFRVDEWLSRNCILLSVGFWTFDPEAVVEFRSLRCQFRCLIGQGIDWAKQRR